MRRARTETPGSPPNEWSDTFGVARVLLAIGVAASLLAVDPHAEDAFEALKRVLALPALAAAAALVALQWRPSREVPSLVAATAAGLAALSAIASPHPGAADGLRTWALVALAAVLGASRLLDGNGRRLVTSIVLAGAAVNAGLALLQVGGLYQPFDVERLSGRVDAGALLGNEGLVGLLMALAVTACAALLRAGSAPRSGLVALGAVCAAALLATRNVTGLVAVGAGLGTTALLGSAARGRRAPVVGLALLLVAAAAVPGVRARATSALRAAAAGRWNEVATFRAAPWAAAVEMCRERPWLGQGPQSFGAAFVPARLAAEMRTRARLVAPGAPASYAEAHGDVLQAAAELGAPGALLAVAGGAALMAALARRAREGDAEAHVLLPLMAAGSVAALAWFPFHRLALAVPLLLVAGRSARVAFGAAEPPVRGMTRGGPLLALGVLLLALPEPSRYLGERQLYRATSLLKVALSNAGSPAGGVAHAAAVDASHALPADARPLLAAAGARLAARDPDGALHHLQAALATGERAEIDLAIGQAHMMAGRRAEATEALLRAAWVHPSLVSALPTPIADLLSGEVRRLEADLAAGRLAAPPPPPRTLP